MELHQKIKLKLFLSFLVVTNTLIFLVMAYFHLLSTDPKSAVFIDFWGRFTVYSLWFIGFALYLKYVSKNATLRWLSPVNYLHQYSFISAFGLFRQNQQYAGYDCVC